MKQTPALDQVQRRMRPGAITRDGLLGDDPRSLGEILDDDQAEVQRLGLTHALIAARLRELRDAGAAGLGLAVPVPPHFEVAVEGTRGALPCPFGHPRLVGKTTVTVRNTRLDEQVRYTDLNIHLIDGHGFYLGRGSAYRLDPGRLARVLQPGRGD
jgi:hypothetical protein